MKIKDGISILLLSLLVLLSACGTSLAKTCQIADQELTQLEMNLTQQEQLLIQLQEELTLLKLDSTEASKQLITAKNELNQSRNELKTLREDLQKASTSIEKANLLFNEYEKEVQRTQRRLTKQRNWLTVLLGLGVGAFVVVK